MVFDKSSPSEVPNGAIRPAPYDLCGHPSTVAVYGASATGSKPSAARLPSKRSNDRRYRRPSHDWSCDTTDPFGCSAAELGALAAPKTVMSKTESQIHRIGRGPPRRRLGRSANAQSASNPVRETDGGAAALRREDASAQRCYAVRVANRTGERGRYGASAKRALARWERRLRPSSRRLPVQWPAGPQSSLQERDAWSRILRRHPAWDGRRRCGSGHWRQPGRGSERRTARPSIVAGGCAASVSLKSRCNTGRRGHRQPKIHQPGTAREATHSSSATGVPAHCQLLARRRVICGAPMP